MSRRIGNNMETAAETYLSQQGLQPLDRNITFKGGEIDLIMRDKGTLVFVEVRFRKSSIFGSAAESITRKKQARLIQCALLYNQKHSLNTPWRIDVVTITIGTDNHPQFDWIKSAINR